MVICDRYEASGSKAWDSTMDVRNRPGWLKNAENKVFERKLHPGFSHAALSLMAREGGVDMNDEQEQAGGGDDHASVLIEITPFPSKQQQPSSSSSPPQPLEHIEQLKRRQEAQMQALFEEQTRLAQQQTQIATQQALLLAQAAEEHAQAAEEQAQRVAEDQKKKLSRRRELEQIEAERDRLQALQTEQLMQTELVLEQQRHYLDAQEGAQGALFAEGCDVQCTGTSMGSGGSTSAAGAGATTGDGHSRPTQMKATQPGSVFSIFSPEV